MAETFASVDDYIASFPDDVQVVLQEVRRLVHSVAPDAEESISYNLPTLKLDGRPLVYFAGWKEHVSLYPVPGGDEEFLHLVAPYLSGKGTARFPLTHPMPHDVITAITTCLRDQHR
jgi:uncharacterized protein YdhG (YjbR/CyaY superfamily)